MSPSDSCRIQLSAAMPGVAFTVVDGTFQAVARGVGTLDVELPHGIYEISVRAGGSVSSELVSLRPGETWKRTDVTVGMYAAAPLPGSRTASDAHALAVTAASARVASADGPATAGLVVAVRRTDLADTALHHTQLTLLDRELEPVAGLPSWEADQDAGIAVLGARLEPGPYVLRLQQDKGPALDQTVWLSEGWQTLVFCPNGSERADLDDASVHLTRLGTPFPGSAADLATATEISTSGLRQGLPLVNEDLLRLLRDSDFANPMLGIVGAHALLLRDPPDLSAFCRVVSELRSVLPDHPDVLALSTHPACRATGLPSAWWPPMLSASYDKLLLPADRLDPAVILDGSPAERVAGYVVQRGPWLCWEATRAMLRPAPAPVPVPTTGPDQPTQPTQVLSATTAGASRRVQRHVLEVANLTGNSQHQVAGSLGATELAKRLQLPIQTVRAVLADLGWDTVLLGTPRTRPPSASEGDVEVDEDVLGPVLRGDSPFAGPRTEPIYERVVPGADFPDLDVPDVRDVPGGPAETPSTPRPRPAVPVQPQPDGPERRWPWLAAGLVTAVILVVAGALVFGGGNDDGGGVRLSVATLPTFFDRANPLNEQSLTVALDGNDDPQQVAVRVDGAGYTVDGSSCASVAAGRSCLVDVKFTPGRAENQPRLATLVLTTVGASELQIPLYGTTREPEGDISLEWINLENPRFGQQVVPAVFLDNLPPGAVHAVVRIDVPTGFDLGRFDVNDKCDTRRRTTIFCWVGLDEAHDDWTIEVPLIARTGAGGELKAEAQLSRNKGLRDKNPENNSARADLKITTG